MELFFGSVDGKELIFDLEETQHITKSKRHQVGDIIFATDGKGSIYRGELLNMDRNSSRARILDFEQNTPRDYELTVAVALLKNTQRFEWFIEKAVELEVTRVIPLITQRTEKRKLRLDRVERIVKSACKQCLQPYMPSVEEPMSFSDYLVATNKADSMYIGYIDARPKERLEKLLTRQSKLTICIGPEGDFTEEEYVQATNSGHVGFTLGRARLRTETAAVAVCQVVKSMFEIGR